MQTRLIKRYTNRKLYDTLSNKYITLTQVIGYIREGIDIQVVDHVTGRDLTNYTLTASLAGIKMNSETIKELIKTHA